MAADGAGLLTHEKKFYKIIHYHSFAKMALTASQQAQDLIKKNKSILIAFKKDWTGDELCSALALAEALKKMDKRVEVVCHDFRKRLNLSFLPLTQIRDKLDNTRKLVISVNTAKTPVGEFYYDREKEKLNIYITPQDGEFEPSDITASKSSFKYDLIIVVGSPDMESLGETFEKNTEFFYQTPKINIDHSGQNEHFGNVNLVDLTVASAAEITTVLISDLDAKLADEDINTYLLTGMIMATKNFKTGNIAPQTLNRAGQLIEMGARRGQIIQNLYQSRFISTLKLWGRVLSRLNNDLDDKLVWSSVSTQDFLETATSPSEIIDVIDELIASMPKTEVIVLLYEERIADKTVINGAVYSVKNIDSMAISKKFEPTGHDDLAKFVIGGLNLAEAERAVITEIKQKLQTINK